MTNFQTIAQIIREQGSDFLLSNQAANVLFPTSVSTRQEDLLGCQILGAARKHDSTNIRFTATSPTKGIANVVDINARAVEVDKPQMATAVFGAMVTKETCSFDHETLTNIHAASTGCASDAQLEAIARSVMTAFDGLSDRFTQLKEKSFWDGVMGQMNITVSGSSVPMTVPTGTTVLPSLVGTDVWTDSVNSTPLRDIDDLRASFRGTGFTPGRLVMNQATYEAFVNADTVRADLGECLCQTSIIGQTLGTVRGMALSVYDGGYIDGTGTFMPYIPDGVVVAIGQSAIATGAMLYECINVDNCEALTYGSHIEILKDKNPMQQAVYHSWIGAPVFTSPKAFASVQVF